MATQYCVYRAFDRSGQLLYIGSTGDYTARRKQHKYQSAWFDSVSRWQAEWYASDEAAQEAEYAAIQAEQPAYNTRDLIGRQCQFRAAERQAAERKAKHNFLLPGEVARQLGITTVTLRQWRMVGRGPRFTGLDSGHVRYPRQAFEEYMEKRAA